MRGALRAAKTEEGGSGGFAASAAPQLRGKTLAPAAGIAAAVPDGEYHDLLVLDPVEDPVREATKRSPTHLAVHGGEGTRHAANPLEAGLHRTIEHVAPARSLDFVPITRFEEIRSRLGCEPEG
jgi:hypothetical protein